MAEIMKGYQGSQLVYTKYTTTTTTTIDPSNCGTAQTTIIETGYYSKPNFSERFCRIRFDFKPPTLESDTFSHRSVKGHYCFSEDNCLEEYHMKFNYPGRVVPLQYRNGNTSGFLTDWVDTYSDKDIPFKDTMSQKITQSYDFVDLRCPLSGNTQINTNISSKFDIKCVECSYLVPSITGNLMDLCDCTANPATFKAGYAAFANFLIPFWRFNLVIPSSDTSASHQLYNDVTSLGNSIYSPAGYRGKAALWKEGDFAPNDWTVLWNVPTIYHYTCLYSIQMNLKQIPAQGLSQGCFNLNGWQNAGPTVNNPVSMTQCGIYIPNEFPLEEYPISAGGYLEHYSIGIQRYDVGSDGWPS